MQQSRRPWTATAGGMLALMLAACGSSPGPMVVNHPSPSPADPPGTRVFVVDTARSTVSYTVTEHVPTISNFHPKIGTFRVTGRAPIHAGTIHLTPDATQTRVGITVDPLLFKTDQSFRDGNIDPGLVGDSRSPLAQFDSAGVTGLPALVPQGQAMSFKLSGQLQIHGIVKPVTLDVTATLSGNSLTASGRTVFDMTLFGVDPPSGLASTVDPPVTLEISMVATAA